MAETRVIARDGLALPADERYLDYACCDQVVDSADLAREESAGGWGECSGTRWIP